LGLDPSPPPLYTSGEEEENDQCQNRVSQDLHTNIYKTYRNGAEGKRKHLEEKMMGGQKKMYIYIYLEEKMIGFSKTLFPPYSLQAMGGGVENCGLLKQSVRLSFNTNPPAPLFLFLLFSSCTCIASLSCKEPRSNQRGPHLHV